MRCRHHPRLAPRCPPAIRYRSPDGARRSSSPDCSRQRLKPLARAVPVVMPVGTSKQRRWVRVQLPVGNISPRTSATRREEWPQIAAHDSQCPNPARRTPSHRRHRKIRVRGRRVSASVGSERRYSLRPVVSRCRRAQRMTVDCGGHPARSSEPDPVSKGTIRWVARDSQHSTTRSVERTSRSGPTQAVIRTGRGHYIADYSGASLPNLLRAIVSSPRSFLRMAISPAT